MDPCCAGAGAAALCLLPLSTKVQRTEQALLWSLDDPALTESCTVEIDGCYRRYLLRDDTFEGLIVLPGEAAAFAALDDTLLTMFPLVFNIGPGGASIRYSTQPHYPLLERSMGYVFVRGNFDDVCIALTEADGQPGSRFLSLGCTTRDEALAQLERYAERYAYPRPVAGRRGLSPRPFAKTQENRKRPRGRFLFLLKNGCCAAFFRAPLALPLGELAA